LIYISLPFVIALPPHSLLRAKEMFPAYIKYTELPLPMPPLDVDVAVLRAKSLLSMRAVVGFTAEEDEGREM
jgi:hypothetical protein